jgi:hypothetical protein
LKFDILVSWKTIVVGVYNENNRKARFLNSTISLIACKIYKYKMYCRIENKDEKLQEISIHVRNKLNLYAAVYKKILGKEYCKVLNNIKDNL